jgi:hypothetical protein
LVRSVRPGWGHPVGMTDLVASPSCRSCRGSGWRFVVQRAALLSSGLGREVARPAVRRRCRACAGSGVRPSLADAVAAVAGNGEVPDVVA